MISREAAFQDSLAQRARNRCPPKSALKARDNSTRRAPSDIGLRRFEARLQRLPPTGALIPRPLAATGLGYLETPLRG